MTGQENADLAAQVASQLKTGSWESAQTLALISIAQSLAVIAEGSQTS